MKLRLVQQAGQVEEGVPTSIPQPRQRDGSSRSSAARPRSTTRAADIASDAMP